MPLDMGTGEVTGNFAADQVLVSVSDLSAAMHHAYLRNLMRHQTGKKRQKLDRVCTLLVKALKRQAVAFNDPYDRGCTHCIRADTMCMWSIASPLKYLQHDGLAWYVDRPAAPSSKS
jgi:hypothetical protein